MPTYIDQEKPSGRGVFKAAPRTWGSKIENLAMATFFHISDGIFCSSHSVKLLVHEANI